MKTFKQQCFTFAKKTIAITLCSSFAFSLAACSKKDYQKDIDQFINEVGSALGSTDYVFSTPEKASEVFYGTNDLEETRDRKKWIGKDADYNKWIQDQEYRNGFFYTGSYQELWDSYEEKFRKGTTFYKGNEINEDLWEEPMNPTIEYLIASLEDVYFGMATRSVELMRLYHTDKQVYFAENFLSVAQPDRYIGMRVVFNSKSDAKEYWNRLMDIDDSFLKCVMPQDGKEWSSVDDLDDRYMHMLEAFHNMDEENYKYDEKKNEGYLTVQVCSRNDLKMDADLSMQSAFTKNLFSIQIRGKEVTMLCCTLNSEEYSLQTIGKLYDKLGLNDPTKTKCHGLDETATEEERKESLLEDPDYLQYFFQVYCTPDQNGMKLGNGVCDWYEFVRLVIPSPLVRDPQRAAWVPYVYDDPEDYLKNLAG